ncbi:MAG: 1-phosphofructokinase [Enterobacteriaceae bacterium]
MRKKRIATITLNPAYDLLGSCPQIRLGEVNSVTTLDARAAGKGFNVARVLKDLSMTVTVGGFLGRNNLTGFEQLCAQLKIINRFNLVEGSTRTNVKLTEQGGTVTDFNFSGFHVSATDWKRFITDSLMWLTPFDLICVSGSLPSGISPQEFADWLDHLRIDCPCVVLDSSGEALKQGLRARPFLVKPNRHELETWAGRQLPGLRDLVIAAREIQLQGVTHVVISLGAEGALWLTDSEAWLAKGPACEVVSTVGAGDAMVGGLIYGLLMQQSCQHTLSLATALATLTVSQGYVGLGGHQQLAEMMKKIQLQPLADLVGGRYA